MLQGHRSVLEAMEGQEQPLTDLPGAAGPLLLFPQVETWDSTQRRCTKRDRDPEEGGVKSMSFIHRNPYPEGQVCNSAVVSSSPKPRP